MEKIIYIKLLDEGTSVYRPVTATKIASNLYELKGYEIYDPEDETWEFQPGTVVIAQEESINGEIVLVAIKKG